MTSDGLKAKVKKWADKIGREEALRRLLNAHIPSGIAIKLIAGKYKSVPSFDKAQVLIREMAKDGFTLGDEEVA